MKEETRAAILQIKSEFEALEDNIDKNAKLVNLLDRLREIERELDEEESI